MKVKVNGDVTFESWNLGCCISYVQMLITDSIRNRTPMPDWNFESDNSESQQATGEQRTKMKEQSIETIPTDRPILVKAKCGGWIEVKYWGDDLWDNDNLGLGFYRSEILAWAELPENKDES